MTALSGAIFEDAERLSEHLEGEGFRPYEDFEILTVTLSDGALEVDPCGRLEELRPYLESFGEERGYVLFPFDPETGTISLHRRRDKKLIDELPSI